MYWNFPVFNFETTYSLKAAAATVLNVTEDHMDRYVDLEDYRQAKLRIYHNAETAVVNLEINSLLEKVKIKLRKLCLC